MDLSKASRGVLGISSYQHAAWCFILVPSLYHLVFHFGLLRVTNYGRKFLRKVNKWNPSVFFAAGKSLRRTPSGRGQTWGTVREYSFSLLPRNGISLFDFVSMCFSGSNLVAGWLPQCWEGRRGGGGETCFFSGVPVAPDGNQSRCDWCSLSACQNWKIF